MAVKISEKILVELLVDPVMACEVILKWELDTFQKAALRIDWWVPETIDSSGVSTGKTLRVFVFNCLRCILIPDHVAGVYFPNFAVGKDEFWAYFDKTLQRNSSLFADQLVMHRGKLGESRGQSSWVMNFKNGSRLIMPAPSFMTDSQTQATRRFNTLTVDDWLRAEDMGDAIAKQLVDRVTRPCFNQNHPIWCNHLHFKGHAERPSHKGHARVKSFKRLIKDGSTRHALYSFCFKDISDKFAPLIRPDHTIKSQRAALPRDQFMRQWLGIWTRDGSTYYPEVLIEAARKGYLVPAFGRVYENEINVCGFDVAPGQSFRADYSATAVVRIIQLPAVLLKKAGNDGMDGSDSGADDAGASRTGDTAVDLPCNYLHAERRYNVAITFAFMLRNKSGPETAGFIHLMHGIFAFSLIVLDPGGGGLWVYKELKKDEQEIGGRRVKVVPLCTPDEPLHFDKQPIVHFFKRGGRFDEVVEPQYLTGDDGFLAACHLRYREAWEAGEVDLPLALEDRRPDEVEKWRPEQIAALKVIEIGIKQLSNVRQITNEAGEPLTSRRGFALFEAKGKKDVAYAKFYAFIGGVLWFHLLDEEMENSDVDESYFQLVE